MFVTVIFFFVGCWLLGAGASKAKTARKVAWDAKNYPKTAEAKAKAETEAKLELDELRQFKVAAMNAEVESEAEAKAKAEAEAMAAKKAKAKAKAKKAKAKAKAKAQTADTGVNYDIPAFMRDAVMKTRWENGEFSY
ncbi:hypothetical protein A6E01_19310 (plasmid) [Vibrio breoganii]|uniref:Uncharacterized protein n=1 Tax=Vibrio breoganii TaxID=553239 RepID=A0AAN0XZM6_9VIBR|nr:hypothetical protein [Vibrio breoganii]ANO35364.1 hypothetical protein A6E01_19310 [Vibrio breoganii]